MKRNELKFMYLIEYIEHKITNHKWPNENYMIAADVGDHHC